MRKRPTIQKKILERIMKAVHRNIMAKNILKDVNNAQFGKGMGKWTFKQLMGIYADKQSF